MNEWLDLDLTYHNQLPLNIPRPCQTVVILPLPERVAVDVRREVTYRGPDPAVERAAVREVSAQTHARGADPAVAGWQGEEVVDCEGGVFVIGGKFLYIVFCQYLNAIKGQGHPWMEPPALMGHWDWLSIQSRAYSPC